ncbi:MAG: hypothetical protein LBC04_02145 [Holosporaceae bacterium]|nr:hypothetical protein [Holosporaceae bacterium]
MKKLFLVKPLLVTTALVCWHSADAMKPADAMQPGGIGDIIEGRVLDRILPTCVRLTDTQYYHDDELLKHTRRLDNHANRLAEYEARFRQVERLRADLDEERQKTQQLTESMAAMQVMLTEQGRKLQQLEAFLGQFQETRANG